MNEIKQYELEQNISETFETVAQATARQALAVFDGNRGLAAKWLDDNLEYLQRQFDDRVVEWYGQRDAWVERGNDEAGFRPKPGYPNAKRKALLDAKRILQEGE